MLVCYLSSLFVARAVSITYRGRSIFVGGTSRHSIYKGYSWNTTSAACSMQGAKLLKTPSDASEGYLKNIQSLIMDITMVTKSGVRAWAGSCNARSSNCTQYEVSYGNEQNKLNIINTPGSSEDFVFYAICEKGE